jgi:hypothetical protein
MTLTTIAFCVAVAATAVADAKTASLNLLHQAANPNPALQSYTASAQLSATLHALVPIHKSFGGAVY